MIFGVPDIFAHIDQILIKPGNNNRESDECDEGKT